MTKVTVVLQGERCFVVESDGEVMTLKPKHASVIEKSVADKLVKSYGNEVLVIEEEAKAEAKAKK